QHLLVDLFLLGLNIPLMDWQHIVSNRTTVKTKDNAKFGYVAGEYKDSIVVIEGRLVSHEYVIPKDKVENYDGIEISLKIRHDEISLDYSF
ncbi:MAG: hypothetical protein ACM3JQ_01830, partial [Candidatus Eiseniibacteriota bacterium]